MFLLHTQTNDLGSNLALRPLIMSSHESSSSNEISALISAHKTTGRGRLPVVRGYPDCEAVVGAYPREQRLVDGTDGLATQFRWVKAPTSDILIPIAHTIAQRIAGFLERHGLLKRDAENSYLASEGDEGPMHPQLDFGGLRQ